MSDWKGFLEESKSYMNHPDYWKEWRAQLYLANGEPDPNYPGWTMADKRKAKLKFWRKFPRAWIRFHLSAVRDFFINIFVKAERFFDDENYHCFFDLQSTFRSVWITGFFLITWYKDDFWGTIDISFYKSGAYE